MDYLRLLRFPNLLILLATLFIVTKCVIYPPLIEHGIIPIFTNKEFYLFLFIITCLGAAGYVHNDITDLKNDAANDKRGFIGSGISRGIAYFLYFFLAVGPLLPLLSLSMEVDQPQWILIYLLIVGIFWMYNTYLKKLPLVGNLVVALLCGFAVLLPYLIEKEAITNLSRLDHLAFERLRNLIWSFAIFCFGANLIREIIKDTEDHYGDSISGFKTLPIVIGITKTRGVLLVLNAIFAFIVLGWTMQHFHIQNVLLYPLLVLLVLPVIFILYRTYHAKENIDFSQISSYWKIYMLLGLISLLLITHV